MRVAALAAPLVLTGTAMARDLDSASGTHDRGSVSSYGHEAPSAGALVTPEDKALGMGQEDARAGDRHVDGDASMWSDDAAKVAPAPSNDDVGVDPRPSTDDASSVDTGVGDMDRASPRYRMPGS
jgi:hypothetical protein